MAGGGIAMAIILLVVVPIGVMLGGALWTAVVGFFLVDDAEQRAAQPPEPA
jgi:hypothetical protein